jgi:hypothetical protein
MIKQFLKTKKDNLKAMKMLFWCCSCRRSSSFEGNADFLPLPDLFVFGLVFQIHLNWGGLDSNIRKKEVDFPESWMD